MTVLLHLLHVPNDQSVLFTSLNILYLYCGAFCVCLEEPLQLAECIYICIKSFPSVFSDILIVKS